ncbi:MAG TPA: ExbD/TolR family protein [Ferrovibrio sp.]|jgi:TolR protein|uniref:ExbD/TolR family protein n=1 Tax=Ferrovibrio sp. TaxID=1917215 RepID=UPI002B4B69DF|nr:ExbD/TolR family protein [Ferrovibrio sp.]HLT78886.1 ExbD/TolR family protein [Ferrovibrio sp.]
MAISPLGGSGGDYDQEFADYRPLSDINVTPFVDVMLVLLIIFMVAAPLMMVGVPLQLPKTSAAKVAPPQEPLVVSIDRTGALFIRKEAVSEADLVARLSAIRSEEPDSVVYVRGDTALEYGRVMQVMGMVGQAGFAKISLVAEDASAGSAGR